MKTAQMIFETAKSTDEAQTLARELSTGMAGMKRGSRTYVFEDGSRLTFDRDGWRVTS